MCILCTCGCIVLNCSSPESNWTAQIESHHKLYIYGFITVTLFSTGREDVYGLFVNTKTFSRKVYNSGAVCVFCPCSNWHVLCCWISFPYHHLYCNHWGGLCHEEWKRQSDGSGSPNEPTISEYSKCVHLSWQNWIPLNVKLNFKTEIR